MIHNAFFSSLSWFLPLVLGVIATPIVVKGLGYEEYGIFSLILGFISYSFAFGIGRAVTKYVAEFRVQNKTAEINEVISATLFLSIFLGVIAAVATVVFSKIIVRDVLQIDENNQETAIKALYIACATIGVIMIGQVFQGIIQALHRFDRNSLLININGIILTAGNIALVFGDFGLNALLTWNLIVSIVNCLFFYHSAKNLLPELQLGFRVSGKILRLVSVYGLGIIGYQIFGNAILIFERSWIIRKLGAESLTFYVVPMTLAIYLHGLIGSLILVVLPAFSEMRGDREKLLNLYRKATEIIFALVVFLAVQLICGSKIILKLWISEEFSGLTHALLIVHVVTFSLYALFNVIWQLAEGFGHPRFNAFISFFWLVISVPLMILLIGEYQNYGVAISRLTGVLLTVPLIFYAEKQFLGAVQWNFWMKLILLVVPPALLMALVEYQIFSRFDANLLTLIIGGALGTSVYVLLLWKGNFFESLKDVIGRRKMV